MVVDGDMDILPSHPSAVALAGAVAGDAMADPVEAAELLDVDVDHLAGFVALVTAYRLDRFDCADPIEATPLEDAADGGRRDAQRGGDLLPVRRARRSTSTCSTIVCGVGLRSRCGLELRSTRPARPSRR
jgi:hypothetical protein